MTSAIVETTRAAAWQFRAATLDAKAGTVEAVLSTETPVYGEILLASGVRFPSSGQVPLLDAHNRFSVKDQIGSVRDIRIEGDSVVGTLNIDVESETGKAALRMIADGHLTDVSVGYRYRSEAVSVVASGQSIIVDDTGKTIAGPAEIVREWTLFEASLVPVGADPNAKIRSDNPEFAGRETGTTHQEEGNMPDPNTAPADPGQGRAAPPVPAQNEAERAAIIAEGVRAERERVAGIRAAGVEWEASAEAVKAAEDKGLSVEAASRAFADEFRARHKTAPPKPKAGARVDVVRDERDTFRQAGVESILLRGNIPGTKADGPGAEYRGRKFDDLARKALMLAGENPLKVADMSKRELFEHAMRGSGVKASFVAGERAVNHSTSDLPYIFASAANKSLEAGWTQAPTSYQRWVTIKSKNDFKKSSSNRMSGAPELLKVPQSGEIKQGEFSDRKEEYAIATYARGASFTRQMFYDDDLGALTDVPFLFGEEARNLLNRLVYAQLIGSGGVGATLATDNKAIFHADHGNYTSTGTAISVASLGVARAKMRKMTDFDGKIVTVMPRHLIVPPEILFTALQVTSSTVDPSKNNAASNPALNMNLNVFDDHLLSSTWTLDGTTYTGSAIKWYLAGARSTIELGLLNGVDSPSMEEVENSGDVLGTRYNFWIDAGAKAIDYVALYLNAGA